MFFHRSDFLNKLNSVKDRTEWGMTPQTVNAYYQPTTNEIVFPAAIMQPPFYQHSLDQVDWDLSRVEKDTPKLLTAINFGGIGAVIAHEITHGYDDSGRKHDPDGNMNDWWQEGDSALFEKKCNLMADQTETWKFENYSMNPQLTMGENLADLGGMSLGLKALQHSLGDELIHDHLVAFFLLVGKYLEVERGFGITHQIIGIRPACSELVPRQPCEEY